MKLSRPEVNNKDDMYNRWVDGEFGNRLRGWKTVEELRQDEYSGLVTVRVTESSSGRSKYSVPQEDVLEVMRELGAMTMQYRFNESAPDEDLIFQGELCESHMGWCLSYDCDQIKMRTAMIKAKHVFGLTALTLVRHFCCPSSFGDLCALLEMYPYHVIEFSAYRYSLGDVPNRNTIIWEVRNY